VRLIIVLLLRSFRTWFGLQAPEPCGDSLSGG
jgi:hypothetical protein